MDDNDPCRSQLDSIQKDVGDIKKLLTGNGDPSSGIIVRLDRLEQIIKSQAWWKKLVETGLIMAIAAAAVKYLFHV